jgi:prepilin-type N-terminal cleavage/methylation domain-containing protein
MKLSQKNCFKFPAFTLIELLVSISILAAMAAISVSSYPKFSEQMSVSAESFKILAYMREAQVYGSSGYTDPGVKVVYGLELDRDTNTLRKVEWKNPNSSTNQSYVTNKTSSGEADFKLNDRFEINEICSIAGATNSCESNQIYDKGYVFFRRPNPEGRIIGTIGSILYPDQSGTNGFSKMELHIRSKQNTTFVKKIVILQTGQMYVE